MENPLKGIDRRTGVALVAMSVGIFLIANDFTALSVAIPSIEDDLNTTLNRAQWVINAYALVFAVLIVTGGRLADLFGRRRIFMIGAAIFAVFSLIGGFSPTIEVLIASRALMGIGGALMWPAILGMMFALLPEEKAGLAGGLLLGVAGLGNVAGPLLGGGLTDALSWRWVFFINVPITLLAMWITRRNVEEVKVTEGKAQVDYRGIVAFSAAVLPIMVALDRGTITGFGDPAVIALFAVGIAMFFVFAFIERRQGEFALIPSDVARNRDFAAACGVTLMISAIYFAALIYLPQFMEMELGFSAVEAGVGLVPMMGIYAVTAFAAGPLYDRVGGKVIVSTGVACLGVGIFVLSFLDENSSYESLIPGMLILGFGIGLFYASITSAAITSLDAARASLGGGIVYMVQVGGGSLGLALNTAIVLSADTFTDGITLAFRVDAALAVVGLILSLLYVGGRASPHGFHWSHLRHHRTHP